MTLAKRRVLVFYDVDDIRVNEVRNFLDNYLCWKNIEGTWEMGTWKMDWGKKHAFEGKLTPRQYEDVMAGLKKIINPEKDGVLLLFRKIEQEKDGVIEVSRVRSKDNKILESHKINVGKMPVPLWVQGIGAWEEKESLYKLFCYLSWWSAMQNIGLG